MDDKFVSTITQVVRPGVKEGGIAKILFDDGRTALLDLNSHSAVVTADVFDELHRMKSPAYVEIDPEDQMVRVLLVPMVVFVNSVHRRSADEYEVELDPSHARHFLRLTTPKSEDFLRILEHARAQRRLCLVTEGHDSGEIIDVRWASNPKQPATESLPPARNSPKPHAVTAQRACELFGLVCNSSCDPTAIVAPCIPFCFPDDGCWARAHQMCGIILNSGNQARKLWLYGDLEVSTRNHPHCKVLWIWHVAPVVEVSNAGRIEQWVIDPSLFSCPVQDYVWKAKQNCAAAEVVSTSPSVFLRSRSGLSCQTDPTYKKTEYQLATYRLRLKLRAASKCGPPPYANCLFSGDVINPLGSRVA